MEEPDEEVMLYYVFLEDVVLLCYIIMLLD